MFETASKKLQYLGLGQRRRFWKRSVQRLGNLRGVIPGSVQKCPKNAKSETVLDSLGGKCSKIRGSGRRSSRKCSKVPEEREIWDGAGFSGRAVFKSQEIWHKKFSEVFESARKVQNLRHRNCSSSKGVFKNPEKSVRNSISGLQRNAPFTSTFCFL